MEWQRNGHGRMAIVGDQKEFFSYTKSSARVVCLFTRESNRRAFALAAFVVRMCVAAVLLYFDCCWLCYTTSLSDLLLNAVALEFVISIDERGSARKASSTRVEEDP